MEFIFEFLSILLCIYLKYNYLHFKYLYVLVRRIYGIFYIFTAENQI